MRNGASQIRLDVRRQSADAAPSEGQPNSSEKNHTNRRIVFLAEWCELLMFGPIKGNYLVGASPGVTEAGIKMVARFNASARQRSAKFASRAIWKKRKHPPPLLAEINYGKDAWSPLADAQRRVSAAGVLNGTSGLPAH